MRETFSESLTKIWRHYDVIVTSYPNFIKSVISAIFSWPQQLTMPKRGIRNYFWVKTNLLGTKWGVNQLSISFGSKVTAAASLVLSGTDIGHFGAKMMTSSWRHHHTCNKIYIFWKYLWSFTIKEIMAVFSEGGSEYIGNPIQTTKTLKQW